MGKSKLNIKYQICNNKKKIPEFYEFCHEFCQNEINLL